ncbi:MAG: Phosphoglucosamine mutase [Thermoanaerobacterales bacterium 50_218]|nr:MAG: Phosphoglucosamine mutase [Thermoanaerobacterales bacterium 50_218]HAA90084.1 phosphoglucosamine mutase [Peptococcaceae bacterium]
MGVLFGTDGVRGIANDQLTPELAFRLGKAGAYLLGRSGERCRIVIGRDTRISGDMLEAALIAGICSVGGDCLKAGVIPTPGLSYLTRAFGCSAGIMVSASHNPVADNGIKFFGSDGFKLPEEAEEKIEELVLNDSFNFPKPVGAEVGRVYEALEGLDSYLEFLKERVRVDLRGLRLVVDCANGAASRIAPLLFSELGAEITVIHGEPDGLNINKECGSTQPQSLQKAVVELGADLGLAFDGDADRLIAVDEKGNIVDGDQIIVICGIARKRAGLLPGNRVVVTVMSNLGLKEALQQEGIEVRETKVGDRYILEEMLRSGAVLGGEQSGHIIFLDQTTTGDGLLTALELLKVFREAQQPLSVLAAQMRRFPQVLVNVRVRDKKGFQDDPEVAEVVKCAAERLGERGRILVRPSGTEPVVRVMAEGPVEDQLKEVVAEIAAVIEKKWGQ